MIVVLPGFHITLTAEVALGVSDWDGEGNGRAGGQQHHRGEGEEATRAKHHEEDEISVLSPDPDCRVQINKSHAEAERISLHLVHYFFLSIPW